MICEKQRCMTQPGFTVDVVYADLIPTDVFNASYSDS